MKHKKAKLVVALLLLLLLGSLNGLIITSEASRRSAAEVKRARIEAASRLEQTRIEAALQLETARLERKREREDQKREEAKKKREALIELRRERREENKLVVGEDRLDKRLDKIERDIRLLDKQLNDVKSAVYTNVVRLGIIEEKLGLVRTRPQGKRTGWPQRTEDVNQSVNLKKERPK